MTAQQDIYASRDAYSSAIITRQDPVVYAGGSYAQALDEEQLSTYAKQGFLVIQDLLSPDEVQALLNEITQMTRQPNLINREESVKEPGSNEIRSIFRVHEFSPLIASITCDPRLLDVARQILGSEVYIHQGRANLKPGFTGKEFYWHSDFETWHIEDGMPNMRALSCSILLTDNTSCNGPLMLIKGSHQHFISCAGVTPSDHYKESLRKQDFGTPDPISLQLLAEQGGIEAVTAPAGSVIFFDSNTLHGSASNISPWPRANLFTVYNSIENQLLEPKNGLSPRPDYLATRQSCQPLSPRAAMIA